MTVWYDVHGHGPTVVLIHAGVADSRMWGPQVDSFGRTHMVMRVDLPGFGQSMIESSFVSYRRAVAEALDEAGVNRAAFAGTSFGGATALDFALDFPERVSALVLVASGIDDHRWSDEVASFLAEEEAALDRGDVEAAVEGLDPPASQRLADIAVPTLILTGDEDVGDVHEIAERLAREIPGAERATIADAAHLPNLERPDEFDRIVLGFLEQHGV